MFSVRVPVLSVAMTVIDPSASTADSLRTTALAVAHPLGTERERQGEHRREALGHGGNGDGDGEQEGFVEAVDALDADTGNCEHDGERGDPSGDPMPEVLESALERRAFGLDRTEHRRDAAHRRLGPGAGDLDPGQPAHGERAREHVVAGGALDRHRFAGQDRLVDLEGVFAVQDAVGGNAITGLDPDQVAGNQHRGVELSRRPSRITHTFGAASSRSRARASSARYSCHTPMRC